jgi:hypothetical protein
MHPHWSEYDVAIFTAFLHRPLLTVVMAMSAVLLVAVAVLQARP